METKYKITTLIVGVFSCMLSYANSFDEVKKVNFAYQIDKSAAIELENQYGEVEIITWEKDSIKIEASIEVRSDDLFGINELFDLVEVNCRGNRTNVMVITEWTEASNVWKRGALDLKKRYGSEKNLVINYKVQMPSTCRLSIKNRFGDVFLPDFNGPLRVEISHGDFRARKIKEARRIEVKYGKILIRELSQGQIILNYGDLIIDNADKVNLESKSSTIEFLEVKELDISSRNDDIRIDRNYQVRGDLTYTQLRVKRLEHLADLNTNYGDVMLRQIYSNFYSIRLNGVNTDFDLEFDQEKNFQFSVETIGNKNASFMNEAQLTKDEEDGNTKLKEGYLGSAEASPLVNIVAKNGYVSFY